MFMEELWGLLVDAQSSLGGIPSAFLQDKKEEMAQAKVSVCLNVLCARSRTLCMASGPVVVGPPSNHHFWPGSMNPLIAL